MIELQRNTDSEKKPNGGFGPFLVEEYGKKDKHKRKNKNLKGRKFFFPLGVMNKESGMRIHLR